MTAANFVGFMHYCGGMGLSETVGEAIEHYRRVYGRPPAVVYINPKHALESLAFDEVVVEHSAYVLPNNVYAGEAA